MKLLMSRKSKYKLKKLAFYKQKKLPNQKCNNFLADIYFISIIFYLYMCSLQVVSCNLLTLEVRVFNK